MLRQSPIGIFDRTLAKLVFFMRSGFDVAVDPVRLTTFTQLLLLHLAAREWERAVVEDLSRLRLWAAVVLTAGFFGSLSLRTIRLAVLTVAGVMAFKFWMLFPAGSNHFFVESICIGVVAGAWLADFRQGPVLEEPASIAICTLRWLPVLLLFWSGVQKLLFGTWFVGTFLAWRTLRDERFQAAFGDFLPPQYLEWLSDHPAGPYRFHETLPIVLSNVVWCSEILTGLLLMHPRTRKVAAWLAIVSIVAIELVARELFFGSLFVMLTMLFVRPWSGWKPVLAFSAVYALLLAARMGVFGEFLFG